MRTILATLLVLIFGAAGLFALPSYWAKDNVVDPAGFVALFSPLGDDPALQAAIGKKVGNEIVNRLNIPDPFADPVSTRIQDASKSVTGSSRFPAAWDKTLRSSHRTWFDSDPAARFELTSIVQLAVDQAQSKLPSFIPIKITVPGNVGVDISDRDTLEGFRTIDSAADRSTLFIVVALAAAALALLVAKRRAAALLGLGLVTLIVAAVQFTVSRTSVPAGAAQIAADQGLTKGSLDGAATAIQQSFDPFLFATGAAGIVVLILGVVGLIVFSPRHTTR